METNADPATFVEGDLFFSWEDFLKKKSKYEKDSNTLFVIEGSSLLSKVTDKQDVIEKLKYQAVRYRCKQGPRTKESECTGRRPVQRSYKADCPVALHLRYCFAEFADGRQIPCLRITKFIADHKNHPVSEEIFNLYPENRRIELDKNDSSMLTFNELGTDEKRKMLEERHGKAILRKDIHNLKRKIKILPVKKDETESKVVVKEESNPTELEELISSELAKATAAQREALIKSTSVMSVFQDSHEEDMSLNETNFQLEQVDADTEMDLDSQTDMKPVILDDTSLYLGQKFENYQTFVEFLRRRCSEKQERWVKDIVGSKTIAHENKKIKNKAKHFRSDLVFHVLNMKCFNGFIVDTKMKARGAKKRSFISRAGCPAKLRLLARHDGLILTKLNLAHNHTGLAHPDGLASLDDKQYVSDGELSEISRLGRLGLPPGLVAAHVQVVYGSSFVANDIFELIQGNKSNVVVSEDMWNSLVKMCMEEYKDHLFIFGHVHNNISTLLLQTSCMRRLLLQYHDFVFVDGTFAVNNLGYPIYVFVCIDGEGKGRVVGYTIVKDDQNTSLGDILSDFIKNNEVNVKTFVIDRGADEIESYQEADPAADFLISFPDMLKTFQHACQKLCSDTDIENTVRLLYEMMTTISEDIFNTNLHSLPEKVKIYLELNWIPLKNFWAIHTTKNKCIINESYIDNDYLTAHNSAMKTMNVYSDSLSSLVRRILLHHDMEELLLRHTVKDSVVKSNFNQLFTTFLSHASCDYLIEETDKFYSSSDSEKAGILKSCQKYFEAQPEEDLNLDHIEHPYCTIEVGAPAPDFVNEEVISQDGEDETLELIESKDVEDIKVVVFTDEFGGAEETVLSANVVDDTATV